MDKTITADGEKIQITRKRIKNMYLRVQNDGSLSVSAPFGISDNEIIDFVRLKADWIKTQREQIKSRPVLKEHKYVSGEPIFVWGEKYTLRVKNGAVNDIRIIGNEAVMTVLPGSGEKRRAGIIKEWYRILLTEKIKLYLPKWEEITGMKCSGIHTKDMKTRWGTCNTQTHKIWLNVRLAARPEICLEYVILHELSHTRVPNHGKDFRAILNRFMPGWENVRRLLNERLSEYEK